MTRAAEVLQYWFGAKLENGFPTEPRNTLWFQSSEETDRYIRTHFESDVLSAAQGNYDDWKTSATGRLALIILLDQFPRNIYRSTAQAFVFDPLALALCKEGLDQGDDQQLALIHRVFYYLPLEHSEALEDQDLSVQKYQAMLRTASVENRQKLKGFVDYADLHRDIIVRFGRFPHRNAVLGRSSTPEELEYLKQASTGFGQG